ncbi:MAG TPA: PDZ domain-containing protein [Thermoanaerobaculia bacterium]|nr:PDZ domain-containing protein [Thermoanaerobaculia bacterium]
MAFTLRSSVVPPAIAAILPAVLHAVLLLAGTPALGVDVAETRLLSDPAVSDRHVAFSYAGDLWIAARDGSSPRRLTSHHGIESSPRFSPDGDLLAFSGQYDGNTDVFVVPVEGGVPTRLTWHPSPDAVEGFTPDGAAILFNSPREVFTNRYTQIFTVPREGGFPTRLPIPNGLRSAMSPDGSKIAYIPIPERFQQWKNYRGGTTSRIWIYDRKDHSVVEVPRPESGANDTDPTWIGSMLYFRSDRAGEFNLFSFDSATGVVEQATRFEDFPILALSSSANTIVFEQAGYLHLFDPAKGHAERLRIGVAADLIETRPRWVSGPEWIRSVDLSPSGARAVFEYRGEILTLPAKKGDARNLTQTTGAHERSPAWSPDGKTIAYFSDDGGEYRLHLASQDGRGEARVIEVEGHGFYSDPVWSPDGEWISYADNSQSLYLLEVASGKSRLVSSEPHFRPGQLTPAHAWSLDSRWLAYTRDTRAYISQVWVYDTVNGFSTAVTDGLSDSSEPVFDRSGKYLYFLASTDAGPVKHWFAMSNADVERTSNVYLAVLAADEPSPLEAQSDEEVNGEQRDQGDGDEKNGDQEDGDQENGDENGAKDEGEDEGEEEPAAETRIDFERLHQRIVALPVPTGRYADLAAGKDGKLFYRRVDEEGEGTLYLYDLEEREEKSLGTGIDGFGLSADGSKLIYVAERQFGIADAGPPIDRAETAMPVGKLHVRIDPVAEWAQIFDEAWRINRDYFYDPNMHGADWEAMGETYGQFLPHLTTRDDLNRVIGWMSSELAVGHHRNGGGDERAEVESVPGGLLGADFEIANRRYRFAKVYGGLNWNPELRSPLTEPGVGVVAGEYLLAVDGVDLDATENVHRRFENTAERIVELTVGPNADGSGSRTVQVVPISNEGALRNRDWVEGNLRKVEQATDGRVAYVYVPNTTGLGHTYFKRYFYPQVHKEAIIVDERFNGGGQVADYYIDILRRPYVSHWATRYGDDIRTPSAAILGPKVMLIDETAGSGGDLLPWMFHQLDLGTLVGKRTWGGLVGVLGFPILMDGGFITAPNLAIWTEDGFVVENVGVPPDVEVEQWPADVIAGRDPQLEKAIEIVLEQLEADPPPSPEKPPYPIRVRK